MSRCHLFHLPLALLGLLTLAGTSTTVAGQLIPETTAARHGLTLAWFNQVQFDQTRGRVEHVVLHEGTLLVTTSRAMLHAMDAETGQTLWLQRVGRPEHPTLAPNTNKELVAVVNGSQLYVLRRDTGKLLWNTQLSSAPAAGPALSDQRVYVPMLSGMVQSFRLLRDYEPAAEPDKPEGKKATAKELGEQEARRREASQVDVPLTCQSWGQATAAPLIIRQNETQERAAWPTDRGVLFVGQIDRKDPRGFLLLYRMDAAGGIVGTPSYLPPHPQVAGPTGAIFLSSRDGYVYAAREDDGSSMWRFPAGEPINQPAVAIDTCVYASTQLGGLYCLDAQKGAQLWWTPQIKRFVARSKNRVYASNKTGQLQILDARNGARLDTLLTHNLPFQPTNTETDRIYLASADGLIQCLREIDLVTPLRYNVPPKVETKDAKGEKPAAKKPAEDAGGVQADPFGAEPKPAKKPAARPARKPRPKAAEDDEAGGLLDAINNDN